MLIRARGRPIYTRGSSSDSGSGVAPLGWPVVALASSRSLCYSQFTGDHVDRRLFVRRRPLRRLVIKSSCSPKTPCSVVVRVRAKLSVAVLSKCANLGFVEHIHALNRKSTDGKEILLP